jgi:hypothetical protein
MESRPWGPFSSKVKSRQVKTSQDKNWAARRETRRTGQMGTWAHPLNDSHTVWHPSLTAVTRNVRNQNTKTHQRRNATQVRGEIVTVLVEIPGEDHVITQSI